MREYERIYSTHSKSSYTSLLHVSAFCVGRLTFVQLRDSATGFVMIPFMRDPACMLNGLRHESLSDTDKRKFFYDLGLA